MRLAWRKIAANTVLAPVLAVALFWLVTAPASAHEFKVAVVVPHAQDDVVKARRFLNGFRLATRQRDGHPDEHSDGHLGGLDVYITRIDEGDGFAEDLKRVVAQGRIDIVVAFVSANNLALVQRTIKGTDIALLTPGAAPFSNASRPGVSAFVSAYEKQYGKRPTAAAAQGYNAARRIATAVRAQGGVDDPALLRRSFNDTARGIDWRWE